MRSDAEPAEGVIAEMVAFIGEPQDEAVEVWPDNWQTLEVFADMLSQWNVGGMGGVIGLRYEALPLVFRMHGIKRERQREIFEGLRVMERAAVQQLNSRD